MNKNRKNIDPTEYGLLFFGGYDPDYPRNSIIRKGWRKCGLPVFECRTGKHLKVHLRYPILMWKYFNMGRHGRLVFVPDFRHKDIPLAWLLGRCSGRKVIFDPLVSRYETRVLDREDVAEGSLQSWHNRNIDRLSFSLADLIIADTDAHARFYTERFSIPENKVRTLYLGFDEDIFGQRAHSGGGETLEVLFYGTYLPLHGVTTIIEAASLLVESPVHFTLVGEGQTYIEARKRAEGIPPRTMCFRSSVAEEELEDMIAGTDIVLGIFGLTPKTDMVIPNKVYQAMAVGKPVITADTPAIRELFSDGEHLITIPRGDAKSLAGGIETLRKNPDLRKRIAETGCTLVRKGFNSRRIALGLLGIFEELGLL